MSSEQTGRPAGPGPEQAAAEMLLLQGLRLAALSPTPDDDIMALAGILIADQALGQETLRAASERAVELVDGGHRAEQLAYIVGLLTQRVVAAGLTEELAPALTRAGGVLLAGQLPPAERLMLAMVTAEACRRIGRVDLAGHLLAGVRSLAVSADDRLRVARAQADLLYDLQDRQAALEIVLAALEADDGADPSERLVTLSTLLTVWPTEREGLDRWLDEIRRTSERMIEPLRSAAIIQLVLVLRGTGRAGEARALTGTLDLRAFRAAAGGQFAGWIDDIERWLAEEPEMAEGGTGAQPRSAAALALAREFGPAGDVSLADAEQSLARGFRIHAFDHLAAAGKFYQMANRNEEALGAFERAFALFEHDVVYLPRASHVIRRLAAWPEIYTRAALAALAVGDPLRAIDFAETGRSRAIGNRIGPSSRSRPPAAPAELWDRYVRSWREAVARAANELIDADGAAASADDLAAEEELDELRGALLAAGARPEDITPLASPLKAAQAVERLGAASAPTTVLYTIRLDDSDLRLVRLSEAGAQEVVMKPDEQERVLQGCDAYVRSLREHRGDMDRLIREKAPQLLAAVSGPLGRALEAALDGQPAGRLLWIPQGSLVAIPLFACPCGDGSLVDRAAVVVSPSLTLGAPAVGSDVLAGAHAVALRGRMEDGEAATDGGDRLVAVMTGSLPAEVVPGSIAEWNAAVADAALVHVTCHGVYDWDDPLRTYLKLGSNVSVLDMFEQAGLAPGALVLFGTCDSGTVAQGDINEAIGLPTAFISAGAQAVVGSAWPVARAAAVATCLAFLRSLGQGLATPEALQAASAHVRDLTITQFARELAEAGHPLAGSENLELVRARRPETKLFSAPYLWSSFVHWGGGWQASGADSDPA